MRLDKLLANMGYGSRKEVKQLLKQKEVEVDGVIVKDASIHVDPSIQKVKVFGEEVIYKEFVYIMMNKPAGVVSATFDNYDRTVVDLLEEDVNYFNPFPVGRLDKDTEGLMFMTNDGDLAHRLLSPKKHIPKKYFAKINDIVTQEDVEAFKKGITLDDGYETMPGNLEIIKADYNSEVFVTIYEGKFHQIKRMFEARGKKVIYLKRLSMGSLKLDESLSLGDYRELTDEELALLKKDVEIKRK